MTKFARTRFLDCMVQASMLIHLARPTAFCTTRSRRSETYSFRSTGLSRWHRSRRTSSSSKNASNRRGSCPRACPMMTSMNSWTLINRVRYSKDLFYRLGTVPDRQRCILCETGASTMLCNRVQVRDRSGTFHCREDHERRSCTILDYESGQKNKLPFPNMIADANEPVPNRHSRLLCEITLAKQS